MTPWRTWLFQRSRDLPFLWKVCGGVVGAAILLAALMQSLRQRGHDNPAGILYMLDLNDERGPLEDRFRRLSTAGKADPEEMVDWIRSAGYLMKDKPAPWTFDSDNLKLGGMDLRPAFRKHAVEVERQELFEQFSRSQFLEPGSLRSAAEKRIHEVAAQMPAPRYANEFAGDLLLRDKKPVDALAAYSREVGFPEAVHARGMALAMALRVQDKKTLREVFANPRWVNETDATTLYFAARTIGDRWLTWKYLAQRCWERWSQSLTVPLALFSAVVWYAILVSSGSRERMRRLRYLFPVVAGVLSVVLLEWMQGTLRYSMPENKDGQILQDIMQYVLHVGLPEEAVKLALFSFFVPVLLRHGSKSKAALTAGCVGLGFALTENVQYFDLYGSGVAVGRLVLANFMHIGLTGIAGLWFYGMCRSKFHRVPEFLTVFLGLVAAHALYDCASTEWAIRSGIDVVGIIILTMLARIYLHHLRPSTPFPGPRPVISCTGIFTVGLALVIAASILISTWEMNSMKGATGVLKGVLAIIPIAVFYVREFQEA